MTTLAYKTYVEWQARGADKVSRYLAQFGEVELGGVGFQLHPKRLVVNGQKLGAIGRNVFRDLARRYRLFADVGDDGELGC